MPRIIAIFENRSSADAVVEQLQLNGIVPTTVITPTGTAPTAEDTKRAEQQVRNLHLPEKQTAEYLARLQRQQYLLVLEANALDLPTVQRILRTGDAVDIDLLPESGT